MKPADRWFTWLLILALAAVPPSGASLLQEPGEAAARVSRGDGLDEIDAILDLLIDDRYAEAAERAARLLEREDLPENVAAWALKLREKAEERLGRPDSREAAHGEGRAAGSQEDDAQPAQDPTFAVRQALVGGGFAAGVSGSLVVSSTGLAFTRTGRTKAEWRVRWQELSDARRDDGVWDAPHPLVIVERGGGKHYLARIDAKGRYLPGDPILAAIEQRRKQRGGTAARVGEEP